MADHMGGKHNDEVPQHPYVSEPKGYALSGKIMLSAIIILFAVVVIMVCLHVYGRWYILRARRRQIRHARRRTHLVFYIEPDNPSNIIPIPTQGLDASLLKALPTFTYIANKGDEEEGGAEVLECAVCLSEFEEKEKGRLLPKCKHCFHVECIDMWFHSHDTCPLCRAPVDSDDVAPLPEEHVEGDEVVVELAELMQSQPAESTQSQPAESTQDVGTSQGDSESSSSPPPPQPSLSIGARRKGLDLVGVSAIEVPRRSQSFCFPGSSSTEFGSSCSPGNGFKSPTSRILSLKRILSREKRSPLLSPSGASCSELDFESGRVGSSSTQVLTPK